MKKNIAMLLLGCLLCIQTGPVQAAAQDVFIVPAEYVKQDTLEETADSVVTNTDQTADSTTSVQQSDTSLEEPAAEQSPAEEGTQSSTSQPETNEKPSDAVLSPSVLVIPEKNNTQDNSTETSEQLADSAVDKVTAPLLTVGEATDKQTDKSGTAASSPEETVLSERQEIATPPQGTKEDRSEALAGQKVVSAGNNAQSKGNQLKLAAHLFEGAEEQELDRLLPKTNQASSLSSLLKGCVVLMTVAAYVIMGYRAKKVS